MLGSCRCSSAMISTVLSAFAFSMSIAKYTINSKVWRPRVFQNSVCVTFGARLRWAPVSVCLAFQSACGAQEQCPESGFDLGRHVWSTAERTDALSGAGDAHGFHEFIGSRAAQCFQVSVEAFSAGGRPGAFKQPHASQHVAHDSDDLALRFPLFQRAASKNVRFSQWNLTILTCLVMLGFCRC